MNPEITLGLVGIVFLIFLYGLVIISKRKLLIPIKTVPIPALVQAPLLNQIIARVEKKQKREGRKWRKGCLHDPLQARDRKNFLQIIRKKW